MMKCIDSFLKRTIVASLVAIGCAAGADAAPVPAAFAVCTVCHKISADGANAAGPNLRGVVGRAAGTQPNYAYSASLRNSGVFWTADKLDQWLAGPSKMIPQVKMALSVANPADRKSIIEYLATVK